MIEQEINFSFDLHELGFPKLKSLLNTINNVKIENDGTTQALAILVRNNSKTKDLSPHSYNKKFCTMKVENKKNNNFNGRTMSNIDDYNKKVTDCIQKILQENIYGKKWKSKKKKYLNSYIIFISEKFFFRN